MQTICRDETRHGVEYVMKSEALSEIDDLIAEVRKQRERIAELEREADDLVALVQRLARDLRKAAPDNGLPEKAMDYLRRKGLQGSPLRGLPSNTEDHRP